MFTVAPIETAPVLALAPQEMDTLVDERRTSHAISSPLLRRREPREWSATYMYGLWRELPRKSIAPMVLALEGAHRNTVRTMPQLLREGAWDDDTILQRHWQEVAHDLSDDHGVLTLDGSDVPQQGPESVGMKRQYSGALATRATCQAGVFLGYTSPHGYTLLDRRLYLAPCLGRGRGRRCEVQGLRRPSGHRVHHQIDAGLDDDPGGPPRRVSALPLGGV